MDYLKITGRLRVTKVGPDGSTSSTYYNNVMTAGKAILAKFISGQHPGPITHMAVGTGEAAVDVAQTTLTSEVFRKQINSGINEDNIAIIDCVYGQGEAIGALREAALITEDGTMFARALINEDKGIYQELTISWEITVN